MKLFITSFLILLISNTGFSQALQKGDIDVHAGLGFGIYNFTIKAFETENADAVPGLLNAGAAYRISDAFALGIDYERNGFVTDADSNSKVVSQNFGITAGYSLLNSDKNVLTPFFQIGATRLKFENFDNQDYVTANGLQLQFGLAWNHYFGERFGMFINASAPYYSYSKFKSSNGDVYEESRVVNDSQGNPVVETRVVDGYMTGVNIRLGLALKL
ncbi:MAG: outer membrane beta-barrel protein [Cytophagales bacterium]